VRPGDRGCGRRAYATLFANAAWHKWRDRSGFALALSAYRLLPDAWLMPATLVLATAETVLVPC
jgi:hypothetical protein